MVSKPVDHVKTRDILEETRREKRDVRVEPVNPVPPEYEIIKDPVANPADKLNLIDPQLIQASVDLIKKTNLLDSRSALNENIVNNPINQDNIPTVIDSEIPPINIVHANEKSVDIQNNANHANIQNEAYISNGQSSFSDKNIPKTLDKSQDNPVHSKSSKDTLSKDIESSTASDKTIPNNGTLGESKTNVPNLLNINDSIKQTDSINQLNSDLLVNSNRTISSDLSHSDNHVNNVASIVNSNNSAIIVNKDTKSDTNNISYVNNNVNVNGKTIDTINSSDVNIKDDITNRNIPFVVNNNERINGANGVNSNIVIITNDKISSRDVNRKKILNTNGITHDKVNSIDVHSNNDVNINGITNPSDVNNNFVNTKGITNDKVSSIDVHSNNNVNSNDIINPSDVNNNVVIIDDKNNDKVNSIDVNNNFVNTNGITNDKVNSIDVNINNNKVSNNQNEQCEVSDSNGEDIQVPHLLSNLNHEELMKDLHLESKFKDHVLNNIVADKA
ncbi:probable cyclin-dependent serine/threonine-protein kinase DDB_G0292550 [Diaphorina citri]|uniref:Probable cyclin-dependent serine/threonine-protein kinase DDB_G0292550 n=1 Tax=Diaphorina citri TaxID=121845 RepID=A0A3Q0JEZ6_DIACI|nr:probable cyclin-dependent serine/threonine-protein kinase DDB_G0292550 [Diaphorina citri]